MTVDFQVAMWAIGIIFLGGAAYADIRARVGRIEKIIGNGHPGVFIRRDEVALMKESADEVHENHQDRMHVLETRIRDLERRR